MPHDASLCLMMLLGAVWIATPTSHINCGGATICDGATISGGQKWRHNCGGRAIHSYEEKLWRALHENVASLT